MTDPVEIINILSMNTDALKATSRMILDDIESKKIKTDNLDALESLNKAEYHMRKGIELLNECEK